MFLPLPLVFAPMRSLLADAPCACEDAEENERNRHRQPKPERAPPGRQYLEAELPQCRYLSVIGIDGKGFKHVMTRPERRKEHVVVRDFEPVIAQAA